MTTLSHFGIPTPGPETGGLLMPKIQNRYRILFEDFGTGQHNAQLTANVSSNSCPSYLTDSDETSIIYITFRDDILNIIQTEFMAQLKKQALNKGKTFSLRIQMMDGNDTVINEYHLQKCKIVSDKLSHLNYSSSQPVSLTLEIFYEMYLD